MAIAKKVAKVAEVEPDEVPTATQPVSGTPRLFILIGLVAIVLLELIVGFFLLPSPKTVVDQTNTAVANTIESRIPSQYAPEDPAVGIPTFDSASIAVEPAFDISDTQGTEATTTTYRFQFALVYDKKTEAAFQQVYDTKKLEIRAEILTILRESSDKEKNDPRLVELRGKILKKVDAILGGKGLVKEIKLTEFGKETM